MSKPEVAASLGITDTARAADVEADVVPPAAMPQPSPRRTFRASCGHAVRISWPEHKSGSRNVTFHDREDLLVFLD
jgi:hypothetical protein